MIYVVVATYGHYETSDKNVWASTSRKLAEIKMQELEEYHSRQKQAKAEHEKWLEEHSWPDPADEEASVIWNNSYDEEITRLATLYQIDEVHVIDDDYRIWIDEVDDQ